jgi:ketosteroid isomerase-like protein
MVGAIMAGERPDLGYSWVTMERENVALVRRTFDAYKEGGVEAMLPFFPPDLVWHPGPGWVEDTVYTGYDGARKMSGIWASSIADLVLEPCEIREVSERVLVLAEGVGTVRDTGVPIRQPYGAVYANFDGGMIGEVWFYFSWQEALEAVGLQQ